MVNNEIIRSYIKGAIASKGKNKGQLKVKCPPMNTPEAAAWLAIMSHVNPYKVGFGHLMFMDSGNREIFDAIDRTMNKMGKEQYIGLDKDRLALESLGVW
jgi:hypothetical protein